MPKRPSELLTPEELAELLEIADAGYGLPTADEMDEPMCTHAQVGLQLQGLLAALAIANGGRVEVDMSGLYGTAYSFSAEADPLRPDVFVVRAEAAPAPPKGALN